MQALLAALTSAIVVLLVAVYALIRSPSSSLDRNEVAAAFQQRDLVLFGVGKKTELIDAEVKRLNDLIMGKADRKEEQKK